MMLHQSAYEPQRLQEPEDLRFLALGAKWGMIYGIVPGTVLNPNRSNPCDPWEFELGNHAVAIGSRFGIRLRKWLIDPEHATWLDDPERSEDTDLLVDPEWFSDNLFKVERAYALSLDWYAPNGWLPPLVRLAACADA